jgi:hypothetical protein
MTDAPLTPAEAYVLLDPEGSSSIEAFKITFRLLVAMEALKVTTVERRVLFWTRGTKPVVSVVRDPPAIFLGAEIVDVVRTARGSEYGHDFLSLAQSAYKRLLLGPLDIVTRRICPALAAREWLEPTEQNKDSFGSRTPTLYRHTPAGLAEKQRIQSLLDRARRLPALIDANPAEATAIVLATGSLLLLVPELRTIYGKLAALDAGGAPDGGGLEFSSLVGGHAASSERRHAGSLQFGSFDASVLDQGFVDFDLYFDGGRFS